MDYTVSVEKKNIKITGDEVLIRGNVEIDYLVATFDSEWDDMERINCVFYNNDAPKKMPIEDGRCEIPWESLEGVEEVRLTFIGYDADDPDQDRRIVTRAMTTAFAVKDHGFMDGEDPAEPTPDVYTDHENRIAALEEGGGSLPEGGSEGQVLTMTAEGAGWQEVPQPDLAEYVTEEALEAKGYLTEVPATSWNDLADKPFYDSTVRITWDGISEGRVVAVSNEGYSGVYCKVSDLTPTYEELISLGAVIDLTADGEVAITEALNEEYLVTFDGGWGFGEVLTVVYGPTTFYGWEYPEAGIYFLSMEEPAGPYASGLEWNQLKTLDPKFLPEQSVVVYTENLTSMQELIDAYNAYNSGKTVFVSTDQNTYLSMILNFVVAPDECYTKFTTMSRLVGGRSMYWAIYSWEIEMLEDGSFNCIRLEMPHHLLLTSEDERDESTYEVTVSNDGTLIVGSKEYVSKEYLEERLGVIENGTY